jgi:hypothetical protein
MLPAAAASKPAVHQQVRRQRGRRALAVRARDRDDRRAELAERELELRDARHARDGGVRRIGAVGGTPGTQHDHVAGGELAARVAAGLGAPPSARTSAAAARHVGTGARVGREHVVTARLASRAADLPLRASPRMPTRMLTGSSVC